MNAAEAELISAREDLRNCIITAPINGIATPTNYTEGNYLTPSSGTLVSIFSVDPIRVRFSVSARDYLSGFGSFENLQREGEVFITLADGTKYPKRGQVELINIEANRNTDTIQIYALFDNPEQKLIPNCTVTVALSKKTGRILSAIPVTAVQHDTQGSYVWLVTQENKVTKRYIAIGSSDGIQQSVVSGLKKGEMIVTDGTHKVMDGMEIEPDRKER